MNKNLFSLSVLSILIFTFQFGFSQKKKQKQESKPIEYSLDAFKLRNLGPAFLSGRIADIAIDPKDENIWYVAVGSGGVWKTINAGTTWQPIFDKQKVYSIGCIAIDPNNSNVIWVGTGENVGGRHVGFGDGIYRSDDGGLSWKNMGLKGSEHISKIIIDPNDSKTLWVAAQGPLWKSGDDRGLYKTTDNGKNWKKVLGNNKWTGATDIQIDPTNPNILYAATWDRHRTVAAYMGGGPGTAIYKSVDGGENWDKLTNGLPKSNMGKIGLAISPIKPNVIYAAIELDRRTGAIYRSSNSGASWTKMSDAVSGATGPHYYQELYASPHQFDKIYLMDVRTQVSTDGGKTFKIMNEENKHSDNHAIVFKKDDPNYLMIGTDAGIYESFDDTKNWRYIKNLPLTQFYKVAVNNRSPFYEVFGGTQDNGSVRGPSATDESKGIANRHWEKTLFADGHQSATDPVYNDIIYAETQQGGLHRIDLTSGDKIFIQPQASEDEPHERFNWDAPVLVSPHKPERIYFGSYRVWKSDNRGDDWKPISGDLTRNEERLNLPIMGRQQSFDNAWDIYAMSNYNTITSLSESPLKEGLIYAGTDDGFIWLTENGGGSWNKISVTKLGLPSRSFVNDIKADLYDENTVYVALDNHKEGDFKPYLFKSIDKGQTWKSMSGNLPDTNLVWRVVQDFVDPNLFFVGTEFGIYTTLNGGKAWQKLPGTPTISFRDLVIQKRESDLVAASFGRGFFILDDYSPLRNFTPEMLKKEGAFFNTREVKWYRPKNTVGNTGADFYFAKNPEYGAVFTYYLNDEFKSQKDLRKEKEKKLNESNKNIPFVGWDSLEKEKHEIQPKVILSIYNDNNELIRKVEQPAKKGSHRVAWKLDYANPFTINPKSLDDKDNDEGALAPPGQYTATLHLVNKNETKPIGEKLSFEVKPIRKGVLGNMDIDRYENFRKKLTTLIRKIEKMKNSLAQSEAKIKLLQKSVSRSNLSVDDNTEAKLNDLSNQIRAINQLITQNPIKKQVGEKSNNSINTFLFAAYGCMYSISGPKDIHEQSLRKAELKYDEIKDKVSTITAEIDRIEQSLDEIGAPPISVGSF